jgi:thiol:disulfide interchange protein
MKLKLLCLGVAAFFLSACSGEPAKKTGKSEGEKEKPTVTATVKSLTEFEDLVASHKGKVVVVDLWAMW